MRKIIQAPLKYVQGENEILNLKEWSTKFGDNAFIIADDFVMSITDKKIAKSYGKNAKYSLEKFNGECSKKEVVRLSRLCKKNGGNVIVGVGGGKTLDTAKAIAYKMGLEVIIVPTIASTDAPCSALSVLYTEDGQFDEYLILPTNPAIILMDTTIIAGAPVRLLVSGMGDALATYFEARATKRAGKGTMAGGVPTLSAFALASLCYETLLTDGFKAKLAAQNKVTTEAVENIIEANTYLSGLGFESGGLAAAHAIHNGFTAIKECHNLYHGEKVAFGTLTQLVLENAPIEEIEEVLYFCKEVGLPTTLEEMGITKPTKKALMEVAKLATAPGETIHNMPFPITAEKVYAAILTADELGKQC